MREVMKCQSPPAHRAHGGVVGGWWVYTLNVSSSFMHGSPRRHSDDDEPDEDEMAKSSGAPSPKHLLQSACGVGFAAYPNVQAGACPSSHELPSSAPGLGASGPPRFDLWGWTCDAQRWPESMELAVVTRRANVGYEELILLRPSSPPLHRIVAQDVIH